MIIFFIVTHKNIVLNHKVNAFISSGSTQLMKLKIKIKQEKLKLK